MSKKIVKNIWNLTVALSVFNVWLFSYNLQAAGVSHENQHQPQGSNHNIPFHTLPQNYNYRATRAILKDHRGFMWFGTENGLVRFDGIHLTTYEHDADNPQSICSNTVNAFFEDDNHNLWIATSRGVNIFNRLQDNFGKLSDKSGHIGTLDHAYVSAISVGKDSVIWIGTFEQGLFSVNIFTGQTENYELNAPGEVKVNITCIYSGTANGLWIGTQSGLVLLHPKTKRSRWFQNHQGNPRSISSNNITSIQEDCMGNIWLGTHDGGLNQIVISDEKYVFQRYNSHSTPRISSNAINKLFYDSRENLWIGTENDGLNRLHIKTGKVEVYQSEPGNEKSIHSNSVWSIYEDNEGRIWIGSYNKGISVIDKNYSKFESYQSNPYAKITLPNNDIRGFCETPDGEKIWVATDGGGICRFDLATRSFDKIVSATMPQKTLTSNTVQSIISGSGNDIWVGSWGGGVDRLTPDGAFIKNYKIESETGVGNNKIRTLYKDHSGNIWASTNGSGLYLFNEGKDAFEIFTYKNILDERSYISSIQSGSSNNYWVGTLSGLIYFELDLHKNVVRSQKFTTDNSALSSNAINSIHVDRHKNIWLGTHNGGINLLNPQEGTFRIFQKKDGLSGNNVSGILEDNDGNIWASTNTGISRIDTQTHEITHYTIEDGLSSNEFYSKSCFKTKNGALLFGGMNGFDLIHPGEIKTNSHVPDILLTGLKINNVPVDMATRPGLLDKPLNETDTLVLNHKQTSFSINFVALNYTRPRQNQFAYKLEGYDDDWNYIGTKRTANYTKVRPGKYTFQVKGSNNDGVWNKVPTALYIVIKPPVWKTTGAYVLYVISAIALITFLFKAWQERIHIRNQLALEKLAKAKEHELNERNLQFFTNVSHEFRTPLSLIIGPVDSLLHTSPREMYEPLKVIQRNAHRLLSLTNNLMDLRKLEAGGMQLQVREENLQATVENILGSFKVRLRKLSINLSVDFPGSENVFWFDNEKFTTIMFNLLSNAIKHTPENGEIRVEFKNLNITNQLEVSVANTGAGIEPSELPFVFDKFYQTASGKKQRQLGTGVGLSLTKGLVELHGGKIWATSKPGHETRFVFTLPVNKSAYKPGDLGGEDSEILVPEMYVDHDGVEETKPTITEDDNDKPIILIVEDNTDLRLFLKDRFEGAYTVILAINGEEGLQKANELTPDLIISDVVMPVMNGMELCKAIKTDVRTSHIPVVILTAKTTTNEQIEGFDTGADAYITKPFHLKLLQTQVAKLIQSRNELYARFSQDVYIMAQKQANDEIEQIFLQKTIDFILENLTDSKLNIARLAQLHNMSHRNFYRKIKALTDNTVVEFIKTIRLKQALRLIESQQYQMSEISYMTGFSSPSYFTKSFREFYGKPPSDYLKKQV